MKICNNCGNKLTDKEKRCPVCKTRAKDFPVVDDGDTEKIAEIIEAVKTKNMSKKDITVKKKKGKGCLIAIIIVVALVIIGNLAGGDNSGKDIPADAKGKTAIVITSDQLIADLKENALKASNTYNNAYVEVTGRLSNIDSSGNYFSISEINNKYSFDSIICYVKEEHQETVSNFTKDQEVTVVGTIKSVGEVMGYSLDVESIK